jgi:hypothetical protein
MVWILAFSVQSQVTKYGAYLAIASFLGLALLSILYFAQAREVRRLRDWAGRAPERDAELEARVASQAEARRAQPVRRPAAAGLSQDTQVTPPPAAVPATNGNATAAPLSVPMGPRPATAAAAVAAAAAAAESGHAEAEGEREPAEEAPVAAPQASVAATPEAAPEAAPAEPTGGPGDGDEATGETDSGGNGTGDVAAIPRATPRPAPAPAAAAPRRAAQPLRSGARSAAVPPRRTTPGRPGRAAPAPPPAPSRGRGRGIVIGVVAGVMVLGVAAVVITQIGGSNDKPATTAPNTTQPSSANSTVTGSAGATAGPARADTEVVILNGTTTDGLAAKAKSSLTAAGYSTDKIPTDTGPNQATQQSTVYYAPNRRRQALSVARVLKIDRVAAVDSATQSVADNSSDPPVKTDVIVVLGADQTP